MAIVDGVIEGWNYKFHPVQASDLRLRPEGVSIKSMKKIYIIFGILQPKSPIEWEIHREGQFVSDFYTRVLEPMNLLNVSQIGIYLNDEEKEIEFFRPSSMFKICNITRGGLKSLLAEKNVSVRFRIILDIIQSSVEFASQ